MFRTEKNFIKYRELTLKFWMTFAQAYEPFPQMLDWVWNNKHTSLQNCSYSN